MSVAQRVLKVLPCLAGALCISDRATAQSTPASQSPSSPNASAPLISVTAQVDGCSLTVATLERKDIMTFQALVDRGVNDRGVSVAKTTTVQEKAKPGQAFIVGKASLACKAREKESIPAFGERVYKVTQSLVLSDGTVSKSGVGSTHPDYATRSASVNLFFSGLSATRAITGRFGTGTFHALPASTDK